MAVIRIRPKDLRDALKRKHVRLLRAIARGALRGAERGRTYIVRKTPVDQGQLKAGWRVIPGSPGVLAGKAPRVFRSVSLAELRNLAPHAGIVELGARPHKTSPEGWLAIYDWVVRHRAELGLVTRSGAARRVRKGKVVVHRGLGEGQGVAAGGVGLDPEIAGIAWAIVYKLQHHGQAPTFFVRSSLDELQAIVQREVDKNLAAEGNVGDRKPGGA